MGDAEFWACGCIGDAEFWAHGCIGDARFWAHGCIGDAGADAPLAEACPPVFHVDERGMDAFAFKSIFAKLPRRYCTKPSEAIIAALSVQ